MSIEANAEEIHEPVEFIKTLISHSPGLQEMIFKNFKNGRKCNI